MGQRERASTRTLTHEGGRKTSSNTPIWEESVLCLWYEYSWPVTSCMYCEFPEKNEKNAPLLPKTEVGKNRLPASQQGNSHLTELLHHEFLLPPYLFPASSNGLFSPAYLIPKALHISPHSLYFPALNPHFQRLSLGGHHGVGGPPPLLCANPL